MQNCATLTLHWYKILGPINPTTHHLLGAGIREQSSLVLKGNSPRVHINRQMNSRRVAEKNTSPLKVSQGRGAYRTHRHLVSGRCTHPCATGLTDDELTSEEYISRREIGVGDTVEHDF